MPTLGQVQLVSEEKQVLNSSFNIIKKQPCFGSEGKVGERAAAPSYHTDSHTTLLTNIHTTLLHPQNNTETLTVLVDIVWQVRALNRSWVCLRTHLGESRDAK